MPRFRRSGSDTWRRLLAGRSDFCTSAASTSLRWPMFKLSAIASCQQRRVVPWVVVDADLQARPMKRKRAQATHSKAAVVASVVVAITMERPKIRPAGLATRAVRSVMYRTSRSCASRPSMQICPVIRSVTRYFRTFCSKAAPAQNTAWPLPTTTTSKRSSEP